MPDSYYILLTQHKTPWTKVRNLIVLSSTSDKINDISNHFWERWRHEYVVNLRETQRGSKLNLNVSKINVNDIVLVYGEKVPKHFCRIAIVAGILPTDFSSESRGTIVKIM